MTLYDLRQFIRLSGLKKKYSKVSCDLLYTKMTKKSDLGSSKISHQTIKFKEFKNELLRIISRSMF